MLGPPAPFPWRKQGWHSDGPAATDTAGRQPRPEPRALPSAAPAHPKAGPCVITVLPFSTTQKASFNRRPQANHSFLPLSIQANSPARDKAGEHWKSPSSPPERPARARTSPPPAWHGDTLLGVPGNRPWRAPSAAKRRASLPRPRCPPPGGGLPVHVTSGWASGPAGQCGPVRSCRVPSRLVPSPPLWPGPSMEKLRRVLSGQDDEEQGLTAQVPPRGDPFFLFFPLPAPYARWPPLTAAELRLQGWRPVPPGGAGGWVAVAGSLKPPCPRAAPLAAASGAVVFRTPRSPACTRCLPARPAVSVAGRDGGATERRKFAACAERRGLWAAGPARE